MDRAALEVAIAARQSVLCVGLDPDLDRLPAGIPRTVDGVVDFCRRIIDATLAYCVAYKPNLAFFECLGSRGLEAFANTCAHVPDSHFLIADAKRGDIGNTAGRYARAYFEEFGCHAITVAPYMGRDCVTPFLVDGHWAIVLALTSNPGSADFEQLHLVGDEPLWERVLRRCMEWGTPENLMLVVGATKAEQMAHVRELAPEHFLLVPGVGAQGGDLATVLEHGLIRGGGLLVNSSRGVLYASAGEDFEAAAAREARRLRDAMAGPIGRLA